MFDCSNRRATLTWFALAFHLGRLLLDDPANAELKQRREDALRKHTGPMPELLTVPPRVVE